MRLAAAVVLASSLLGCAEEDTTSGPPPLAVSAAPVVVSGSVHLQGFESLPGVDVCLWSARETCEVTDEVGEFRFEVPTDHEEALVVTSPSIFPVLAPFDAQGGSDVELVVLAVPRDTVDGIHQASNVPREAGTGMLVVLRSVDGATPTLSAGAGPIMLQGPTEVVASPTTVGQGTFAYLNVPPGEQQLGLTHPSLACDPPIWPGDAPESGGLPIEADTLTIVFYLPCE
jgi:hypothetical protein